MPELAGWSHLSLSVRDRDASVAWYREVLGFQPLTVLDDGDWLETIMLHPAGMVLAFQQHTGNGGETFHHARTGLDHLSFAVASRQALEEWAEKLAGHSVKQSPIADTGFGQVLCFRDPDDVQLELFYSPLTGA